MEAKYISCPKCDSSDISVIVCKCMMCFDYICDSCQNEFDRKQFLDKQNAVKSIIKKLNVVFGVNDYVFLSYYVDAIRKGANKHTRKGFESKYNLENFKKNDSHAILYYPEDNNSVSGSYSIPLDVLIEIAEFFKKFGE